MAIGERAFQKVPKEADVLTWRPTPTQSPEQQQPAVKFIRNIFLQRM